MKKRLITILALFLLLAPLVYAQDFTITNKAVKDRVAKNEWAVFDVTIENNQNNVDTFTLSSKVEGTEWSLLTESTFDYTTGVTITPKSSKTVRFLLKDKGLDVNQAKAYVVDLTAKSVNTGEKQTTLMKVFIISNKSILYESDISIMLNIPRYIDPRNIYSFVVNIKNNNPKDIKNLNIRLESSLFTRDATVELAPEIQKAVEFTVGFDESQKPLLDTLTVIVRDDGEELYRKTTPVEIVSYRIPFGQESTVKKSFLKTTEVITLTNKEIVQKQQRVFIPLSAIDRLFISAVPEAEIIEKDDKKNLAWDIKLAPGESTTITIITNYRIPFYILVLIAVIAMLYYVFRDPIVILKHAECVKKTEGGISELKVVLNFKNRSRKEFRKVTIVDRVPSLVEVEKKYELGTLPPRKILKTKKGTLLTWELEMDPKEERLIKYLIKSRLSILGRMKLPPALVFVHDEEGKKRKIKSNEVNISEE